MTSSTPSLIVAPGEHALIVGQNGSGKTAFACWYLMHVEAAPIIIYDTKVEPKFERFPAVAIVEDMEGAAKYVDDEKIDYIVVRPDVALMGEPRILDDMLWYHYQHFAHCPAYIDEAFTFQINGRAGRGLLALLTRGRSRGISTIISTQRPVRLDRACITEARRFYVFRLNDRADRKRLDDVIPNFSDLAPLPKFAFYYFEDGMESVLKMKPVKLDPMFNTGYTDISTSSGVANTQDIEAPPGPKPAKHLWV